MLVISFNSYKGGACRTTTCYNTLPYLAKKLGATSHQPVLVFDVDLDSMGMTSLMGGFGSAKEGEELPYSSKHMFVDDKYDINRKISRGFDKYEDVEKYYSRFTKVGGNFGLEDDGCVLFCGVDMQANTISDDALEKQSKNPPLRVLISALKMMDDEDQPKAIVFDCASGVQQTTLSVLASIDKAVMCMRPTDQFRIGTRDYLLKKIPDRINRFNAGKKRQIVLLPTSVSPIVVSETEPNYQSTIDSLNTLKKGAFDKINNQIIFPIQSKLAGKINLGYELNLDMINQSEGIEGIPEIERFKWQESKLLYTLGKELAEQGKELTEQEKLLQSRYEMLASVLVEK